MAGQKKKLRVESSDPWAESGKRWIGGAQNGARQIRSFVDDFLGGNPSWENGLHQLQQQNPGWARGAEQLGSFFTGTPERQLRGQQQASNMDRQRKLQEQARHARRGRAQQDRVYENIERNRQPETDSGMQQPKSFTEYLRMAEEMLGNGGGGVNYDPQRQALRQNTSQATNILSSVYGNLQQQFAQAAPAIDQRYADAGNDVDLNTAQAANAVNTSNSAIRDEQTRQLAALGIEDAAANLVQDDPGSQQASLDAIQRQGQIAGNANDAYGATAGTYNDENKATAGMEGASKQALLQANLLSALADVDAREGEANASLSQQSRQSALSLAQSLMEGDPEGASAAAARAQAEQEAMQQQWENDFAVQELLMKYPQQQVRTSPVDMLNSQAEQAGWELSPTDYAKLLQAYAAANR